LAEKFAKGLLARSDNGGDPHRFRDTFAVELLMAVIPLERVSFLLGHSSLRITEKHYSPWIHARQEQLEADLERSWAKDPIVLGGFGCNEG
jgi:integrase